MPKLVSAIVFEGSQTQNMQGRLCFLKAYDNGNVYLGFETNPIEECIIREWFKLPPTLDDVDNDSQFKQELKGEWVHDPGLDLKTHEANMKTARERARLDAAIKEIQEVNEQNERDNTPYIHPGERNA